jgi:hypothetical protein
MNATESKDASAPSPTDDGGDVPPPSAKRFKSSLSLASLAELIINKYPDSDLEVAMDFCCSPITDIQDFVKQSNDRLLKVGRNIRSLVTMKKVGCDDDGGGSSSSTSEEDIDVIIEAGLKSQVEECKLLSQASSGKIDLKIPTRRFGKTNIGTYVFPHCYYFCSLSNERVVLCGDRSLSLVCYSA